jgi:putative DNA primase/helicase
MAESSNVVPMSATVTEDSIAHQFSIRHRDELRFDHSGQRWLIWSGSHWAADETGTVIELVAEICRGYGSYGVSPPKSMGKKSTISSVEFLSRSKPLLATTAAAFDADKWVLGTPGGIVDLRTGEMAPSSPESMISRITTVAPSDDDDCAPDLWIKFITQCCAGDMETVRFLQRVAGYCLTGLTQEHLMFFVYGPGGNGKSVFVNTLAGILGDYARSSAIETFTAGIDRHPTELARLAGARFVHASETEEGRAWAESRIKQLTGGDKVTARFMRQDEFEYVPQFKLIVIGNHRPRLRSPDDSMKRRLRLIPFTARPGRPDKDLEERLKLEWPAILRWMINGCIDWQAEGLGIAEKVNEETGRYFDEQDLHRQWIDERTVAARSDHFCPQTALYGDWMRWCKAVGEEPGSINSFTSAIEKRGFNRKKGTGGVRGFTGITLRDFG